MKKLFKSVLFACAIMSASRSQAATVAWSAQVDTGVIDSNGAALSQGNYVLLGYFGTLTNTQIAADAQTPAGLATLYADFHTFASTTIGAGTSLNGSFSALSSPTYSSLTGFTPSSQMYMWVLDSTNNSSLSNALATATQTGIAYVPYASNSDWQFPASDISGTKSPDLTNLSNANSVVLAGSYISSDSASLDSIFGSGNHALQLSSVSATPEPSRMMLLGLALLAMVGHRRRI